MKHGPTPGSSGAVSIARAHTGSKVHDQSGGFAADRQRASIAGTKGGNAVLRKYGVEFLRKNGRKGGETVKRERGSEFYSEIGRRGGIARSAKLAGQRKEAEFLCPPL